MLFPPLSPLTFPFSLVHASTDIILLSDGRSIYHGEAEHALPYFEAMGYTCPLHFNPAEFMLDLVSIDNARYGGKDKAGQGKA